MVSVFLKLAGILSPGRLSWKETPKKSALLAHYFLDLADLFLNFPVQIFDFALGFQVAIPDYFPDGLFDLTFCLVHLAFCVVFCAWFHDISPV
jgi:hypothetical protein